MLVELVAQPHCLYLLCTEAIKYVYTILALSSVVGVWGSTDALSLQISSCVV